MHRARFINKASVADNVYSYRFQPSQSIDFIPGQFIELSLPHKQADDRGEKRWFSVSSAKTNEHIEITTKIDTKSPSTYKQALQNLSTESEIFISDPMGDFVVPKKNNRSIVFLLAGVGTAPAHSIITSTPDTAFYSFITAKNRSSMPFVDSLERRSTQTHLYETTKGHRLNAKHVQQALPEVTWQRSLFFIAGPEQFCETIKTDLLHQGIDDRRCIVDYFHGYDAI